MKKNVLLSSLLPPDLTALLRRHFNLFHFPAGPAAGADFYAALAQAHGLIGWGGMGMRIDAPLLQRAANLRAVSTISVGYDHCDLSALNERGILLTNTPDVLTDTTADAIFGLLLATARRLVELDNMLRRGQWTQALGNEWLGSDVHHKTIAILGMGRIGQAVARRASLGFAMPVLYTSNQPKTEAENLYQARRADLDTVLASADFVVITLSLNPQTRGLITAEKLALMKDNAMLINGARGAIVDEKALIAALQNKTIAAAGLDVFEREPLPLDSPLLTMSNVVLLPHVGSGSRETRYAMAKLGVENLVAALSENGVKQNCVNPQVLGA